MRRLLTVLELIGFVLLVVAAALVSTPLAFLVAGAVLIFLANIGDARLARRS